MIRFPYLPEDRPTRVYLIRHGEVTTFQKKSFNGHNDVALTPHGILQLEEVGKRLSSEPLRAVYTSDLQRSIQGGKAIAKVCSVPCYQVPALREKHFGAWEGYTAQEISRRDPRCWNEWVTDPFDCRPEGGESYRDVSTRAGAALEEILKRHPGEEIAIVAHGGVNRVLLAEALGQPPSALFRIEQKYAALNVIDYFQSHISVKLING
jgi:alpha-ribazole phosphatase/probable phosphoglycerate mutase